MSEIDNIVAEGEKIVEAPAPVVVQAPVAPIVNSNLEQTVKDLQFDVAFKDLASTSPAIKEYRDAIKDKVAMGLSVIDASVLVLHSNNKLVPDRSESLGGSAATPTLNASADPTTPEGWAAQFQALEAKGEITIN